MVSYTTELFQTSDRRGFVRMADDEALKTVAKRRKLNEVGCDKCTISWPHANKQNRAGKLIQSFKGGVMNLVVCVK